MRGWGLSYEIFLEQIHIDPIVFFQYYNDELQRYDIEVKEGQLFHSIYMYYFIYVLFNEAKIRRKEKE